MPFCVNVQLDVNRTDEQVGHRPNSKKPREYIEGPFKRPADGDASCDVAAVQPDDQHGTDDACGG